MQSSTVMPDAAKRRILNVIVNDAEVANNQCSVLGLLPASPDVAEAELRAFRSNVSYLSNAGVSLDLLECANVAMKLLLVNFETIAEGYLQPELREDAVGDIHKFLVKYAFAVLLHLNSERIVTIER